MFDSFKKEFNVKTLPLLRQNDKNIGGYTGRI